MTNNHRIVGGADDWMRDVERRIGRQERRPAAASLNARFGPAVGQRALKVADWNDPEMLSNGWYSADTFSINSPDPDYRWLGTCVVDPYGRGVQELWSHGHIVTVGAVREFDWPETDLLPTFTQWQILSDDTGYITATLGNSFTHFDMGDHGPVWYARVDGWVSMGGLANNTVATASPAFVMPQGFRPYRIHIATAQTSGGPKRLDVRRDGTVQWIDGCAIGWNSFTVPPYRAYS
jgi:hypothetical protein